VATSADVIDDCSYDRVASVIAILLFGIFTAAREAQSFADTPACGCYGDAPADASRLERPV